MITKQSKIEAITVRVKNHNCSLRSGCIQAVPGDGNAESELFFIGEAPGRNEDEQGKPFVGSAGKVLQKLLEGIDLNREDIYITNVVKCRPPENRDPTIEEVEEHKKFLISELNAVNPKLIILLGRHALNRFLPGEKISEAHGKAKRKGEYVYLPVYHPAAVLHNPNLMVDLKNDFAKIPKLVIKINKMDNSTIQKEDKGQLIKIN